MGDRGPAGWGAVSAEDLQADEGSKAGPVHAGPAEAAGCADEDHGQRCHLLHAANALHLHLQVGRGEEMTASPLLEAPCICFRI